MDKDAGLNIKTLKNVDSNTICYHPWSGISITAQGYIKPCGKYKNNISSNLETYQQSLELTQLKKDMLENKRPDGCSRCWRDEDSGIISKRQMDWKYFYNETKPDLNHYKVMAISFGNSCNLACRICNSYSSSTWITEAKKMKNEKVKFLNFPHTRYYQDKVFMSKILESCNHVEHIHLPGGEPFIAGVKEHLEFLDRLIQKNSSNITLHYITNGTQKISNDFYDRWKHFKHLDIQFSIDGTEKVFEYGRYPAKWNEVYGNLKDFQLNHPNFQISISNAVSVLNIWNLQEYIHWCKKENLPEPYLGLVTTPYYYSIQVLPNKVKEEITKRLTYPSLKPIIEDMWSKNSTDIFQQTMQYVKVLDRHRNQNFPNTFPELFSLLEDHHKQIYYNF